MSPTLPSASVVTVDSLAASRQKRKVIFILGSTGTGKSKLAISLAAEFNGEIINSDKIQVYDGLDVITNKVTEEEAAGIPHHLLGGVHPETEFTASDFRREAALAIDSILGRGRLPIVAGGSNTYIEELADDQFRSDTSCIFLWVSVDLPVLDSFVSARVDGMVERGLVEEARGMFSPEGDYSRGIRKAIGVPEMDRYFRAEGPAADEEARAGLLRECIEEVKSNTRELTRRQLEKILRLSTLEGWDVRKVDATEMFLRNGKEAEEAWERVVRGPSVEIVQQFLNSGATVEKKKIGGDGDGDGDGGAGAGAYATETFGSTTTVDDVAAAAVLAADAKQANERDRAAVQQLLQQSVNVVGATSTYS